MPLAIVCGISGASAVLVIQYAGLVALHLIERIT